MLFIGPAYVDQRTLVTKEAAQKLGLDIIGTERAYLIGYGNKKTLKIILSM